MERKAGYVGIFGGFFVMKSQKVRKRIAVFVMILAVIGTLTGCPFGRAV
jgi:hypothetical protein